MSINIAIAILMFCAGFRASVAWTAWRDRKLAEIEELDWDQ